MYSDKENVNILTSLLIASGVHHAVVCPGSRNAPIVNNLNECEEITCYPVTDERSAGFQAIGLSMAEGFRPVVVCVTSGSALLNLYPAVAEAYYQQVPLIVISADRPMQWIGQIDGQTLPQPHALGEMVRKTVTLPEVCEGEQHDEMHWYCNRLVNEALQASMGSAKGPVHINVPISEPLYNFNVETLPQERTIKVHHVYNLIGIPSNLGYDSIVKDCHRPMFVFGQLSNDDDLINLLYWIGSSYTMLWEPLAMPPYLYQIDERQEIWKDRAQMLGAFDFLLDKIKDDERFRPDLVIYAGGHIVSKKLKEYLRSLDGVQQIRLSPDCRVEDTFMHLTDVIDIPNRLADMLFSDCGYRIEWSDYCELWVDALGESLQKALSFTPRYSSLAVVKEFWDRMKEKEPQICREFNKGERMDEDDHSYCSCFDSFDPNLQSSIFSGNSSAIRLMNIYADRHVYCNRGVNGIEGSLSTAVGFSLCEKSDKKVFCVLGDLSFFYDQNALWNQNLNGKLRIIVLNNGGGAIFGKFDGLRQSAARENLVMAQHHTSAEGICKQNDVVYLSAHDMEGMKEGIKQLMAMESARPVLLEVFTDLETDNKEYETLMSVNK